MSHPSGGTAVVEAADGAATFAAPKTTANWLAWTEAGFTLWLYYVLLVAAIALPPFIVPASGSA